MPVHYVRQAIFNTASQPYGCCAAVMVLDSWTATRIGTYSVIPSTSTGTRVVPVLVQYKYTKATCKRHTFCTGYNYIPYLYSYSIYNYSVYLVSAVTSFCCPSVHLYCPTEYFTEKTIGERPRNGTNIPHTFCSVY